LQSQGNVVYLSIQHQSLNHFLSPLIMRQQRSSSFFKEATVTFLKGITSGLNKRLCVYKVCFQYVTDSSLKRYAAALHVCMQLHSCWLNCCHVSRMYLWNVKDVA